MQKTKAYSSTFQSPQPFSVLYVVPEMGGKTKFGGLGDAAAAMGKGMRPHSNKVDFRYLVPGTPAFHESTTPTGRTWQMAYEGKTIPLTEVTTPEGLTAYLVDDPLFSDITSNIYNKDNGLISDRGPYLRGLISAAACALAQKGAGTFKPDIVHLNDYLFADVAEHLARTSPRTIVFGNIHILKAEDSKNPVAQREKKALFNNAATLVTVSPTFAQEIQQAPHGAGWEKLFRSRASEGRFFGILNGIDPDNWSPAKLVANDNLPDKRTQKKLILQRYGMSENENAPLVSAIHRIDPTHKGIDIFIDSIPDIIGRGARVIVHGQGDAVNPGSEKAIAQMKKLEEQFPDRFRFITPYTDQTAKEILWASDFHCSPSRFEPGGYSNLNGMAFGAVPVVTPVGGLCDAVTQGKNGYIAEETSVSGLKNAFGRAISLYWNAPETHAGMSRRSMHDVQTCQKMAEQYMDLYSAALARKTLPPWALRQAPRGTSGISAYHQ